MMPSRGDKTDRMRPLAGQAKLGNVAIVQNEDGSIPPWAPLLIEQSALVPHGTHDDMIDAVAWRTSTCPRRPANRRSPRSPRPPDRRSPCAAENSS